MIISIMISILILFIIIIAIISLTKKDGYTYSTRKYIRNTIFFRLKMAISESANLSNEAIEGRVKSIVNLFLDTDANLDYKVKIITNGNNKNIHIEVFNGLKNPFKAINEHFVFKLTKNKAIFKLID